MKRVINIKSGSIAGLVMLCLLTCPVSVLADGISAKVMIKDSGFYRVSKAQVASVFGMSESAVVTNSFHVSNMGRPVAAIRDNGDIVFFGSGFSNQFTDENVYWIKLGPGSLPGIQNVTPGTAPLITSGMVTRHFEQQVIFRADIIRNEGGEQEDPLYWRLVSSGLSSSNFNINVALDGVVVGTGGAIKVRVKGATDIAGRYYHRARLVLNNTVLGTFEFEGLNTAEMTFTVPSGLWVNGNNTLRVQSNPPPGTTFDSFYLDFVDASYQRQYVAQTNRLVADIASPGSYEISSLSNTNILFWNVSDPWMPKQVDGAAVSLVGTNVKVSFNTTQTGKYAFARLGGELAPVRIATGSVFNLKSPTWQLDHLTIAEPALKQASVPVKNLRAAQGMLAELISIEDVYDSFNFGIRDPRALQALLGYAYRNWVKYPKYVFLVGDGSLDYKNSLGANDSGIPSLPHAVNTGLYATDYLFGDIDNDGFVEIAVGRLPVNTVSNVNDFVEKLTNYEAGGAWRTNTMITTDLSDYAGDFYGDGNYLEQFMVNDRDVHRADFDVINDAGIMRTEIIDGVNDGKEVTVYIGHGTPNQLSLQSIILSTDSALFTNKTAPSTFVMIGCLVGSFANPAFTGLGESLIKAQGGAVSLLAAATLISAADGRVLTEEFLDTVYTDGADRLGDGWINGKNQLTLTGRIPAYKAFQLLGDPGTAMGNAQAPVSGNSPGPSRGTYEEWKTWMIPPVLADAGPTADPQTDLDGDQFDNYSEFMAGTDPFDGNAFLEIIEIKRGANNDRLVSWPSAGGRNYTLERAAKLSGPYEVIDSGIPATAPVNTFPTVDSTNTIYYRVWVE